VGGLPVRESAVVEAQDTHFSLELFEMVARRVNAVLALGTTDHVLPSPTPGGELRRAPLSVNPRG
jgi:hypothetical protein